MRGRSLAWSALAMIVAADPQAAQPRSDQLHSYAIEGDAIPLSLTGKAGDPGRGALLMQQRQKSLCVLCHAGPFPDPHLQGTLAPDLRGVGGRLSAGQLRLRIVDMKQLNPDSIMPTYYATVANSSEARVAADWRDKPILTAGEIEDLVAYLQTLQP